MLLKLVDCARDALSEGRIEDSFDGMLERMFDGNRLTLVVDDGIEEAELVFGKFDGFIE